jgi:hypothetical protein
LGIEVLSGTLASWERKRRSAGTWAAAMACCMKVFLVDEPLPPKLAIRGDFTPEMEDVPRSKDQAAMSLMPRRPREKAVATD